MNLSLRKVLVPTVSAALGGLVVFTVLKTDLTSRGENHSPFYEAFLRDQNRFPSHFGSLFSDPISREDDPFIQMRTMHEQMEKQIEELTSQTKSPKSIFGSLFSSKFEDSNLYDISQREDDGFIYYDIHVNNLKTTSLDTKVENGYVTISGTMESNNADSEDRDKKDTTSQYHYLSTFNRTFPLPENVDAEKMQMTPERNKIVLRFPKISGGV